MLASAPGRLRVGADGRSLVRADGEEFFWLGDTAWELAHRLDREEVEHYLCRRQAQGFTVIQTVALAELEGLTKPNAYGHLPLIDADPARPDVRPGESDYWDHLDFVIDAAARHGMIVGLLPTWGSYVTDAWGEHARIFDADKAAVYGRWLAQRYRHKPNLVWINGGDCAGDHGGDELAVWRALATAIKAEDPGHLMTFHPRGHMSSSAWFHDDAWLDFNMCQSGHGRCPESMESYRYIEADYARAPAKPCLDGEPCYEDIPIDLDPDGAAGLWTAAEVRRKAYWSLFAGAFGFTYGQNSVWQMHRPGDPVRLAARLDWQTALDRPGAGQMQWVKKLMLSHPMAGRIPDQSIIVGDVGAGIERVQSTRGAGYAMVYTPTGGPFTADLAALGGPLVRAKWYDPRTGDTTDLGEFEPQPREFRAPGACGPGNDWVLVLDYPT